MSGISLSVGEISFIVLRLEKIENAIRFEIKHETMEEEESIRLHKKVIAIGRVISLLKGGRKGLIVHPRDHTVLIAENIEGHQSVYPCAGDRVASLYDALIESGQIVEKFWVVPDEDEQITVYPLPKGAKEHK